MALPHARTIGWREGLFCALVPVLIEACSSLRIPAMRQPDGLVGPDSFMRLVRLRDILAAHAPLHAVARDGSGHGTVLHWSHLLDSFLLVLATPLGWFMPQGAALHAAGLLWGAISLAALGYACVWAVAPFVRKDWRWIAPVAGIMVPTVWAYGLIGVVHHHLPVVLVAVMSWGWAARVLAGRPGGVALGAWAAAGVWLTPEALPLSVLGFGAVFVAWVERGGPRLAAEMRATGLTMAAVTGAAWFVDPPLGGRSAMELDRISIVFVGVAAVFAALGCAIAAIERRVRTWPARLFLSALFSLVVCGVWLLCFRSALDGSQSLMDDFERHVFFDRIVEMMPVNTLDGVTQHLLTAVLATAFLVWLFVRYRSAVPLYAACAMAVLVAAGATHLRFATYPGIAAALLLPAALDAVRKQWMVARLAIVVVMLVVPLVGAMVRTAAEQKITAHDPTCEIGGLTGILAPFGDAVVLANVNDTPEILYRTRLRTVGSLYHRHSAAFMRLRAAWRSVPGTAWQDERGGRVYLNSVSPPISGTTASSIAMPLLGCRGGRA